MSSLAKQYADFVIGLKYEDIPPDIVNHAKNAILDTIGLALSGIYTEEGKFALAAVKDIMPGNEATIWGEGSKASVLGATLANATCVNSLEYEAGTVFGYTTSSTTIAPAIAVAEKEGGISGKKLIESYVVGSEIINRISVAASMAAIHKKGFSHSAVVGPFGSTAAVAKILNLDSGQIVWAFGLAGNQSCGTLAFLTERDMSKRFLVAKVGGYGIVAAYLAKHGFTGPTAIFEAEHGGFLKTYLGEWDASKLAYKLGKEFWTKYNKPKIYPTCRHCFSAIDATSAIIRKHDVRPDQIEKIYVDQYAAANRDTGITKEPKSLVAAQFSVAYCIASTLIDKELTRRQFTPEKLKDPAIIKLARKVETRVDPKLDKLYGFDFPLRRVPCRVTIKMRDGKEFSELCIYEKGSVKNPVTDEELYQKYIGEATYTLPRKKAEELATMILNLEEIKDIREIVAKLV